MNTLKEHWSQRLHCAVSLLLTLKGISAPRASNPESRGHGLCKIAGAKICVCVCDCVCESLPYADTRDAICFHPVRWRTNAPSFFMRVPTSVCFLAHPMCGLMQQEAAGWRRGPHQLCCKRKIKRDTCLWCPRGMKKVSSLKSGCTIAKRLEGSSWRTWLFLGGQKRPLKQHFDRVTSKAPTWNQYQWNPIAPWGLQLCGFNRRPTAEQIIVKTIFFMG